MARKSSIARGPEEVRATIDRLIRQGRLTLDEIIAYVRVSHGEASAPSRSALHRYSVQAEELMGRMRDIDAAARVVVEELGENADDRAGALLVQSITTLATDAALRAQSADPEDAPSIEEIRKLARAAKDVIDARKKDRQEREEIARLARERLLAEQTDKLDKAVKSGGLSADAAAVFRTAVLGVA